MKKNLKSIIAVVLLVISGVLAVFLYVRIKDKNDEKVQIAQVEDEVMNKLIAIRRAEVAYFSAYNQYTDNWDSLKTFINTGKFYLTERKETIVQKPSGGDSVVVQIDTLGFKSVKDSLFVKDYPNLNIATINKLPHADTSFNIYAAVFDEGAVIEVEDSKPINPARQKGGQYKPLKFGSQNAPSTKGNWEK